VDVHSDGVISSMKASSAAGAGGSNGLAWGSHTGNLQIDNSIIPLRLDIGAERMCVTIKRNPDGYYEPDCENVTGLMFPLPVPGAIEGTNGYGSCDGDCHLTIYDVEQNLIWEAYGSSVSGNVLTTSCVIIWDLTVDYPTNLRGDQCTSVDAAGFPVGPLLGTSDEVWAGSITHALRLALPNNMLQTGVYAHPATHASSSLLGPDPSPFYGMRMRLKSSFVNDNFPNTDGSNMTAISIIFDALKTYGMFMADGSSDGVGGIPLIMASDMFSTHKWGDINIDSHSLFGLTVDDFEVVQVLDPTLGPNSDGRITLTFDCVRNYPTPSNAPLSCSSSKTATSSASGSTKSGSETKSTSSGTTQGKTTSSGTTQGTTTSGGKSLTFSLYLILSVYLLI